MTVSETTTSVLLTERAKQRWSTHQSLYLAQHYRMHVVLPRAVGVVKGCSFFKRLILQ